jgi:hypothetical protein
MLLARIRIDEEGKVTRLRVIRPLHVNIPEISLRINEEAMDMLRNRQYKPTLVDGKPVEACADVSIIIHFR